MQINQEKIPRCQKNRNCAGAVAVQSIYKVSVGDNPNECVIVTIWS